MQINFVFTNYNNSLLSIQAIESIWKIQDLVDPHIVIVDNFSEIKEINILKKFKTENLQKKLHFLFLDENIGYFKGLNKGINYLNKMDVNFDYFIIGNNDLIFPEMLLKLLCKNNLIHSLYPVISPNLITLDNVHQNPHVLYRISRMRKIIYDFYFYDYNFAKIISTISKYTSFLTKRKDSVAHKNSGVINMGYGACYLLTTNFFDFFKELDAKTFLMGEEAFLSNQIHSKGLEIYYDSEIEILHYDHASCGKIPARKMWEFTSESYKLYRKYI